MKNKIGWCNLTWNPVVGCRRNCDYCYAREMNTRFRFIKFWNDPEWKENNFRKKFPQKTQKIFIGSMSEIHYWDKKWVEKVLKKIKQYPQHVFQFLTKYPDIYFGKYEFPKNCWLGTTITGPLNKGPMEYYTEKAFNLNKDNLKFISFEPLLEEVELNFKVGWVIIGAETGQRPDRVIPKKEWIEKIIDYCRDKDIPIYLKNSLREIYPVEIKEFPGIKAELLF
jgi:protein gp37